MQSRVKSSVCTAQREKQHQGRAITKLFTNAGSRPVSAGASSAPRPPTAACRTGTCRLVSRFENKAAVLLAACPHPCDKVPAGGAQEHSRQPVQRHTAGVPVLVRTTASALLGSSRAAQRQHSRSVPSAAQLQSRLRHCAISKRLPCVGSAGARAHGSALRPSHERALARSSCFFKRVAQGSRYLIVVLCPGSSR